MADSEDYEDWEEYDEDYDVLPTLAQRVPDYGMQRMTDLANQTLRCRAWRSTLEFWTSNTERKVPKEIERERPRH